jgi:hypothetical protein
MKLIIIIKDLNNIMMIITLRFIDEINMKIAYHSKIKKKRQKLIYSFQFTRVLLCLSQNHMSFVCNVYIYIYIAILSVLLLYV